MKSCYEFLLPLLNFFETGAFYKTILALFIAFLISAIFGKYFVNFMKKIQPFGQIIKDIMPENHKKKAGTVNMGGIIIFVGFFVGIAVVFGLFSFDKPINRSNLALMILFDYYFLLGLFDDALKSIRKTTGIKSLTKLAHQFCAAFLAIYVLSPDPVVHIPFIGAFEMPFYLYYTLCVLGIVGASNAFNFTDGLDGLATLTIMPVIVFLMIVSHNAGISVILGGLLGGMIGFFVYNKMPAKIFMGDCGSLPIGGCLALIAIVLKLEFFFVMSGFMCFIELISVSLQVIWVKFKGKRLFLLAPLHHHLEKKGIAEKKIVYLFAVYSWFFTIITYCLYCLNHTLCL